MSYVPLNRDYNEGLYRPDTEHGACGIGFVAHLKNRHSHKIVKQGLELLENLEHRGATGHEKNSGDGAGILIQINHEFFLQKALDLGLSLPQPGEYGVGMVFLPQDDQEREECREIFERCITDLGQKVIGWRKVPVDNSDLGQVVLDSEPIIEQVFIARNPALKDPEAFERKLYVIRKLAERSIWESSLKSRRDFYVCSLSFRTIIYKGRLVSYQVGPYFDDLRDPLFKSAIALVHSRFSTNTFPTWSLAQPFRLLSHNGEINTLKGNRNWMKAREALLESDVFSVEELAKIKPIIDLKGSDSASLDNAVELLYLAGRSLPHVLMMLIPEAWAQDKEIDPRKKAFYEYHATMMEPWDGPASVAFSDGRVIGATLDRNGLRPSRYIVTDEDILIMGSEVGALQIPNEKVILKDRLMPGRMFLADLEQGRIISDEELKKDLSLSKPYLEWLEEGKIELGELEQPRVIRQPTLQKVRQRQTVHGYTQEDLKFLMKPMIETGVEATGSMGTDTPLAVLSDRSHNLFNYFHQMFAQVTNPPIDPIREASVMSLVSFIGEQGNILDESEDHCRLIEIPQPILTNDDLEKLRWVDQNDFTAKTLYTTFLAHESEHKMEKALRRLCDNAKNAIDDGYKLIILSDRSVDSKHAAIPSLLATSAVHHHLIREGLRARCGIVVESGEPREVHHFACLLGYGANAINPYLAFDTVQDMMRQGIIDAGIDFESGSKNFIKAVNKGLLKIMSKMGISTLQSYIGAQIFEAVGLDEGFCDEYMPGTISRIGGIDIKILEKETLIRHTSAYPKEEVESFELDPGGQYQYRLRGERHLMNPNTIHKLQFSSSTGNFEIFREFSKLINDQNKNLYTLRGLLDFTDYDSIPLEEVESIESILKRFSTGGMSFGSISAEAHETMAIAMNRIGAKSNTGEGGEDPRRFTPLKNGDSARSAIKQVASGRFGVTMNYLTNSDEIQIKIAQGAKPGEGGQLPGKKVNKIIGKTRYSTPGVGLISPPPHHDIYSIEDLAQLIFDLKNANNKARVNVKLVSEVGVGTIAAGVAKAHADVIVVAGMDGGTGASPQTSIKHAGLPWELGVAETHQVLVKNHLRDRVVLQTDGQIRTGRDVAIATLLGAEEWGVGTAALIVQGCIMMRKCHLNTCPVGIATQDEELRKLFTGKPEDLVNYFTHMAMEMREIMAQLGFRSVDEMVGRVDKLRPAKVKHWKASTLDLNKLLYQADKHASNMYCCVAQDHGLDTVLDNKLIELAAPALNKKAKVSETVEIRNVNRTTGTRLSSEITRKYGETGLDEDTIRFKMTGSGGQSFGAFVAPGVTLEIEGEANDYFGKGLSGGKLILYPPPGSQYIAHKNVSVGNVAFYGATSGNAFIRGKAGERFCVRNSGVEVVVGSIGDHGCEYMTGGRAVILGSIGYNFAAGMSGGIAYIWDEDGSNRDKINLEMVELETLNVEDEDYVQMKIKKFIELTGSVHSRDILENWNTEKSKFIKVMPVEYKRALALLAEKENKRA